MNSSTSEMNQEAIVKVEAVFGERIDDVASKTESLAMNFVFREHKALVL